MKNTTLFNHTNKEIELHKEQQILMFERVKVSQESYNHWHKKYMESPTPENEMKSLKAFEFLTFDMNNLKLHQVREMEERLRVAQLLLEQHGIEIPTGFTSITE